MVNRSQLNKGVLEGCVLQIISEQSTYGYDIVMRLESHGFREVREGTVYPLLVRLETRGLVTAEYVPSTMGPSRKYYKITEDGRACLGEFKSVWDEISRAANRVLGGEKDVQEQAGAS